MLDGSGSIDPEDFTRAKEFIQNVMKSVWTKCYTVSRVFKKNILLLLLHLNFIYVYICTTFVIII